MWKWICGVTLVPGLNTPFLHNSKNVDSGAESIIDGHAVPGGARGSEATEKAGGQMSFD